jgi:long-chain fatty acid transport protein
VLGIELVQEHYSIALAKEIAPGVSVGIAPVVARQYGKIQGASLFSAFSSDPANFSNTGTDESWGFGVRGGVEWKVVPGVTLGVAGSSKFDMSEFDKYAGLLAEQGDFDIPPMLQAGVAFDVLRNVTFMVDYRHIWFSQVASASNPSSNPLPFGTDIAAGYGVRDLDVIKLGVEWAQSPSLTLRAGYSYNTAAIGSRDADLNIMTLGVVQHHITGGFKYTLTDNVDIEFAAMYAPRESVRGVELLTVDRAVEIEASQVEFTLGTTYRFGGGTAD